MSHEDLAAAVQNTLSRTPVQIQAIPGPAHLLNSQQTDIREVGLLTRAYKKQPPVSALRHIMGARWR